MFNTLLSSSPKIGEAAFDHYYSSFMGKDIPGEYRITEYKLNDISLLAGDEKEFCVAVNYDHTTSGLYFLSANGGSKLLEDGSYAWLDSYGEFRIKSLGNNEYQIVGIGTGGGAQGLTPVDQTDSNSSLDGADDSIKELVENNLNTIMSSPKESSNPQDYIDAHQYHQCFTNALVCVHKLRLCIFSCTLQVVISTFNARKILLESPLCLGIYLCQCFSIPSTFH